MKHVWTVLCQKSSIDIDNNLLSLFNCLEELELLIDKTKTKEKNLVIPVEFQLVSFWTITNQNQDNILETEGEFIDPNGQILNKFINKFNIKKGISRFRNRTNIQGLPLTEAGTYIFRIKQKKENQTKFEVVAELPLAVKISYKLMDLPKDKI